MESTSRKKETINLDEEHTFKSYVNIDSNLGICGEWTKGDTISNTLDGHDNDESAQSKTTQLHSAITSVKWRKYIESNESIKDWFKPLHFSTKHNRYENILNYKQFSK